VSDIPILGSGRRRPLLTVRQLISWLLLPVYKDRSVDAQAAPLMVRRRAGHREQIVWALGEQLSHPLHVRRILPMRQI
jgi:hypothetical protein